jgi:hypothetical protein
MQAQLGVVAPPAPTPQSEETEALCVVCMDAPKRCVVLLGMHMCTCEACTQQLVEVEPAVVRRTLLNTPSSAITLVPCTLPTPCITPEVLHQPEPGSGWSLHRTGFLRETGQTRECVLSQEAPKPDRKHRVTHTG